MRNAQLYSIWILKIIDCRIFSSVQFSCSVVSDSLRPRESQHATPPCPSPTPGVHSNSCPSSRWCHPAISSSVVPFSSCPQPLPASESFPMSQLFAWGGQSIGVSASASVLPMNTQDWSPLGWTGWISSEKTIALTRRTFVGKVISLLFNMLSRLVITFLSRSKHRQVVSSNSWDYAVIDVLSFFISLPPSPRVLLLSHWITWFTTTSVQQEEEK